MANANIDSPKFESLEERAERTGRADVSLRGSSNSFLVGTLEPLASLKLTIVLFAMSIFIVLAGTLAQRFDGIWHVINTYFRILDWGNWGFVWVELRIFFPSDWDVSGSFPFPSGWLIGAALFVNLLAAHALRFKIQASGARLWGGLAVITLGVLATAGVIATGMYEKPNTQLSDEFAAWVWNGVRMGMVFFTGMLGYLLYMVPKDRRGTAYWILFGVVNLLCIFDLLLYVMPEMRLDKPGLRIMWQLVKGLGAGVILLAGCAMVFRRRAGIVLLHAGIGLMMVGELWTGVTSVETQMPIFEGYPGQYLEDIRVPELVVIEQTDADELNEIVVPRAVLIENSENEDSQPLELPDLPLKVRVLDFFDNVDMFSLPPGVPLDAPELLDRVSIPLDEFVGLGRTWWVKGRPVVAGAEASSRSDVPSAHIELFHKETGESLGKYLVSVGFTLNPMEDRQYVKVGDQFYEVVLRFKRQYTDLRLDYKEFRFDKYVGTQQAKNYSAKLQLIDPDNSIDTEVNIWMNNPLRYEGWTYYQSGVRNDPRWPNQEKQGTVLQVVSNDSWLIPYVGWSLVLIGMGAHFLLSLVSYLRRRDKLVATTTNSEGMWAWIVPAALAVLAAAYAGSKARTPETPVGQFQIDGFGQLPVAYQGRVKPIDTLARNALRVVSGREKLEVEVKSERPGKVEYEDRPAIVWLLDLISNSEASLHHKFVRIDSLDVLSMLELKPQRRFRYSLEQIRGKAPHTTYEEFVQQIIRSSEKPAENRTPLDRQILTVATRLQLVHDLEASFGRMEEFKGQDIRTELMRWRQSMDALRPKAVFTVPPLEPGGEWDILQVADVFNRILGRDNEIPAQWISLMEAYRARKVDDFNRALRDLTELLEEREEALASDNKQAEEEPIDEGVEGEQPGGVAHAETLDLKRVAFEKWFNAFAPFEKAKYYYVAAFALSVLAWLCWGTTINRSALWLLGVAFLLHTFGLAARIYISGRPPVTNLYSSAVFIGWGCVLLGMIFEAIYKMGFGNIMSSVAGFATLLIAHALAADGDTVKVLQAVLDTNFWLATHVVCITFGYATTFVAGLFGIIYILGNVAALFGSGFSTEQNKALTRMTYGTLCFSIFFSFIGTVLGGLWADDSWGRFWGWDPKENGALLIVIWNALVLHARWGGMAGPRGIAVLSVFGNIVTAWSWFGVNQLGVGLHSYGFTDGTVLALTVFFISQLAIMAAGCIPVAKAVPQRNESPS